MKRPRYLFDGVFDKHAFCEQCGNWYGIGQWPFCPHDMPQPYHPFKAYLDEHLTDKPVYIESLAQRRRLMRENNCDYRGKKMGMPGVEF